MFRTKDWKEICQNVNNGDPKWWDYGLCFFLLLYTVLYFASSLQTSTCKLCKEKQRKAVLSQLFIVSIFCGNSEEKSPPYFKGNIKLVTI